MRFPRKSYPGGCDSLGSPHPGGCVFLLHRFLATNARLLLPYILAGPYLKCEQFSTLHSAASYIKFWRMERYYTNVTYCIGSIVGANFTYHELGSLKLECPVLAGYHHRKKVAIFPNYGQK